MEQLLASPARILGITDPPSGAQGAKLITLRARRDDGREITFRVKWRPQTSADLLNEPRKELASYAVQKLFLADDELVAPPTAARCFPLSDYQRFQPGEPSSFAHVPCVLGFASYWLEGVKTVDSARSAGWLAQGDGILDRALFQSDPVYRRSISNANLLTYLINHGDAHNEQFLLERTGRGLRAYVVDSSIAFLSIKNPMLLVREDWSQLQVPSLPPRALSRLRSLSDADFAGLGKIALLEQQGEELVQVDTHRADIVGDGKEMSWHGARLRIGLTTNEVELVRSRVKELAASAR